MHYLIGFVAGIILGGIAMTFFQSAKVKAARAALASHASQVISAETQKVVAELQKILG